MTLPMFYPVLGLVLGIVINSFWRVRPAGVGAAFIFLLPLLWTARGRRMFVPLLVLATACLGAIYTDLGRQRPENAVENFAGGARVSLEGVVKTSPEAKVKGKKETVSFVLESKNLMRWIDQGSASGPIGHTARREFHETKGDVQVFLFNPWESSLQGTVPVQYGDRVRLWGKLEAPRPALNPGQFDYGKYLVQKDIYAIFNGFGKKSIKIVRQSESAVWRHGVERLRSRIERRITELYRSDLAPIFKALILGKRSEIDPELRDDLMKTGTSHLLAISGLHITLAAGTLYAFLLMLRVGQKAAALAAMLATFVYVFVAGLGIPVQRAGWMAGAMFLALILERDSHSLNLFFFAFFILAAADPQVLTNISFQLSFLSVFSLIVFLPRWPEVWRWKALAGQSTAVTIGTFPLVLYYFNIFSPVSILANIGAIPIFHLALLNAFLALLLGFLPGAGGVFSCLAGLALKAGLGWIHLTANVPAGYYYSAAPSLAQLAAYYGFLACVIAFGHFRFAGASWIRAGFSGLWLFTAASFFWPRESPPFQLTLFAAGKNELAYIESPPDFRWLLNAGRRYPSDQGQWILQPFLRQKGIKHFSGIFLADAYARHRGGTETLLRNFSFDYFLYPAGLRLEDGTAKKLGRRRGMETRKLKAGDEIPARGNARLKVLDTVGNDRLIFYVTDGTWNFLFLPDLEPELVRILEKHRKVLLKTNVLVMSSLGKGKPQHDVSDLEGLFDLLDPEAVSLPHEDSFLRDFLAYRDIPLLELERQGAVSFTPTGTRLEAVSIRSGPVLSIPSGQL